MNAKKELVGIMRKHGLDEKSILCAAISIGFDFMDEYQQYDDDYNNRMAILKLGYDECELPRFFEALNVDYHDGFGMQELFGYVLFKDRTWLERHEDQGSEWWEYKKFVVPKICR